MGTALYSLGPMQGARLWLLFWLAGAVCYLGVCLAVLYSRNESWLHYGIGGVYGLLLWVPLLALAAVAVTARNKPWK